MSPDVTNSNVSLPCVSATNASGMTVMLQEYSVFDCLSALSFGLQNPANVLWRSNQFRRPLTSFSISTARFKQFVSIVSLKSFA